MAVTVEPLVPALWPAFEDLFGAQGACAGCWCAYFRLPAAEWRPPNPPRNKALIEAGPPPGLLAFEDEGAVGWMQIGPRADVPEWNGRRRVSTPLEDAPAEDPSVWAISCFFIRAKARRNGLTHRLVAAGIGFARAGGARLIEACPMTRSKDSRSVGLFVGSARVFEAAGFKVVAERKPGRPLMRLELGD